MVATGDDLDGPALRDQLGAVAGQWLADGDRDATPLRAVDDLVGRAGGSQPRDGEAAEGAPLVEPAQGLVQRDVLPGLLRGERDRGRIPVAGLGRWRRCG